MQAHLRQVKDLRDDHGAQWNDMTGNITDKVIDAAELEPTYRKIEDSVDPLGLLILLEKVCTKNSVNNVEALRTDWQELRYKEGDCVFAFFNRFDALIKIIDRASGVGDKIRDWDKIYRLRQALPLKEARSILVTAFTHERTDKEYPSYDWCKRVTTNYYRNASTFNNDDDDSPGNAYSIRQSDNRNPRGGKFARTDSRNERVKSQNDADLRRPNIKPTDFCTTCGESSDVHITTVCPKLKVKCPIQGCRGYHMDIFCFFNPKSKYAYPDVVDRFNKEQKHGGKSTSRNNTPRAGRAYRVEADPYAVGEDDPQPIEGNFLANWNGRCNVASKHEEPEEAEVDYSPDTPESGSHESVAGEVQSEEEVTAGATNTTVILTPAIVPDPPHTLTFNGRQWTMAQLEALTAQQNNKNATRLRSAGWGVLNSRTPTPPALSPPVSESPAPVETEVAPAHPEEGAAHNNTPPAPRSPEQQPPVPPPESVSSVHPEEGAVTGTPAVHKGCEEKATTPSAESTKAKAKKDTRDKRDKKASSPTQVIPAAGPTVTTAPPAKLSSETAWSATGRENIRAQREQQKNLESAQVKAITQQTDSGDTVHKVTSPLSLTPPELCDDYVAPFSPTTLKPPTPPPAPSPTPAAAPSEAPITLDV
ncbi:hypothetical protein B484DRAFT_467348 [Ochromonadaceae sp. CCMP2298]|nr:hypothetical protein B484DRAFT_467348 [Ochromonadaceae sp. CCMP2298]